MIGHWSTLGRAARDAAYDNTAAVADSAALIAERNAASAAFRARADAALDLRFGETAREAWDIFRGPDPAAPVLAFVHGGYWQRNRREDFACMAEGALRMGWNAALCGYTLAPEATLARIAAQLGAALDWLAARGGRHGAGGPAVLAGWSAGGHLAALGAAHPHARAALCVSGIFELGPLRDTALDAALRLSEAEVETLSPLRLPAVAKPVAVAYGTRELPALVGQSRRFHAHRAAAHAPGPLIPVAGADHFTVLDALRRPGGALLRAAAELLR